VISACFRPFKEAAHGFLRFKFSANGDPAAFFDLKRGYLLPSVQFFRLPDAP
jgi:hypothetical protein